MEFKQILKSYKENGFVVVKDIVDKDQIENCNKTLCKMSGLDNSTDIEIALKNLFVSSKERYLQTLRTFSKSLEIQKLFLNDRLVELVYQLGIAIPTLPTQPVTHATSSELVVDDGYLGISAHQDWPSIQGSLDSIVVWIPFTDIDSNNYPIQILPKSHLNGIREAEIKSNISEISLSDSEIKSLIDINCNVGDLVVFSTFLIHRTKPIGKGFRFSASIRYDNALENSFFSRNFPCSYKRIVDRNLSYKPLKKDINKVFI